jgi:hypothetical protein
MLGCASVWSIRKRGAGAWIIGLESGAGLGCTVHSPRVITTKASVDAGKYLDGCISEVLLSVTLDTLLTCCLFSRKLRLPKGGDS